MHESPIIFDLDGTLVDSLHDLAASLNAVLAHLHCAQHPIDTVRTMIGGGAKRLLERGLGPSNGHKIDQALERFRLEYSDRMLQSSKLFPGIEEVLAALRADGRTWSIATNKPAMFTKPIIDGLDLHRFGLRSWASADEVSEKKPAPDVVRLATDRGGFAAIPVQALTYVGDMPVDVACGRRLGCATVGVTWGFDPEGVAMSEPDYLVDSPEGLLEILRVRKNMETDKHQVGQEGGGSVQA